MQQSTIRCGLREALTYIRTRHAFDANGTFWGLNGGLSPYPGELPIAWTGRLREASKASDFYVVFSYKTPIAWYADHIWTIPAVTYGVTTSRHQSVVRKAIA